MNVNVSIESTVIPVIAAIPDPLHGNHRRHRVHEMVFAAIVSVMCGFSSYRMFETFVALNLAWFRAHGCAFGNGVPDANTFQYLFAHLDPGLLSACLRSVAARLRERIPFEVVSFDGKAARRGRERGGKTPFIVNAWSDAQGIVLGEVKVDDKSNEITAMPKLLELLGLEGCIVTIDAMGCQKKIVRKVFVERKAHYVVALKDNQKTFHDEMLLLFEKELETSKGLFRKSKTVVEKHHGRIEKRTCYQTDYIGWFRDKDEWAGLKSVIMIVSERTARNKETGAWETSTEKRLYISSLKVDPDLALKAVRTHWGIENRLHWTLDVTFGEDYCTARALHAAENRATLTRIAVNLLNRYGRKHKCGTKKARMMANQSPEALEEMLAA